MIFAVHNVVLSSEGAERLAKITTRGSTTASHGEQPAVSESGDVRVGTSFVG